MEFSEARLLSDSPQSPRKSLQPPSSPPSGKFDDKAPWSTQTPKKPPPRSTRDQQSGRDIQLPEQYEALRRLFNGLDSALTLLRMRKSVPFFTRIRAIVEGITGRRFVLGHLAQMKFLMPEEVVIKRVSIVDNETGAMKRDLHVTLIRSEIKSNKKRKRGNDHRHCMKKLFQSQLIKFLKRHPKGTEIPEEVLPVPSEEHSSDPVLKAEKATGLVSCSEVSSGNEFLQGDRIPACHISQSFRRHFSKMTGKSSICPKEDDVQLVQDSSPCKRLPADNPSPAKSSISIPPVSPSGTRKLPPGSVETQEASTESTPVKLASTPEKLMVGTPSVGPPPKSLSMTPDDVLSRETVLNARPAVARSLQFDFPEKNADVELELDDAESSDVLEIVPHSLVQSLKEKDKKTEEQTLRRKMLATGLPKLFDRVYYLFQSIKYSAIRKEALLHRLTTCHCDITDEGEVEEQLMLLQEALPEWISHKLSPGGDTLLSIDKSLDLNMLRSKLNMTNQLFLVNPDDLSSK